MADKLGMSLDDIVSSNAPKKGAGKGAKGGGKGGAMKKMGAGRGARAAAAPYQKPVRPGKGGGLSLEDMAQANAGPAAPAFALTTGTMLRVGNLDSNVSSEDVEELFGEVGALKSATVATKADGSSKGFAHVTFKRKADAEAALERYNNVPLDGKPLKITLQSNVTSMGKGKGKGGGADAVQVVASRGGGRTITVEGGGKGKGGRGRRGMFDDDDEEEEETGEASAFENVIATLTGDGSYKFGDLTKSSASSSSSSSPSSS